jgi:hypothetical protein
VIDNRFAFGVILLPCFISQTFLREIVPNIATPIFGLLDGLRAKPRALRLPWSVHKS